MNTKLADREMGKRVRNAMDLVGPDGRIQQALDRASINPNALAKRIGELRCEPVTPSTVYGWVKKGGSPPGAEYLVWLPEALGVNGDWLLTGRGEPDPTPPEEAQQRLRLVRVALDSDDVGALVDLLEGLDPKG